MPGTKPSGRSLNDPRARDGSATKDAGIVTRIDGELTIGERLERFEEDERRVFDLRRSLNEQMQSIRRGEGVFDVGARQQLAELRRRERALRDERAAIYELVEQAKAAVLTRRGGRRKVAAYEPARSPSVPSG